MMENVCITRQVFHSWFETFENLHLVSLRGTQCRGNLYLKPLHDSSICHSGLDKPAPYSIRGNLGAVLAQAGNH